MKLAAVLLLSLAALTYAADQSTPPAKAAPPAAAQTQPVTNPPVEPKTRVVKKMGSVTWDPDAHKLLWTVQTGSLVNGEFVPASEDHYEISPDEATMGRAEEKRELDGDEAEGLHQLLDVLSLYCAKSVAWWDGISSAPVQSNPAQPDSESPQKPVKIRQPQTNPAPVPARIPPGQAVAYLH
jgi:hypothetical protein